VPHLTDESNTNTLPDPELNPMLNPLLAAHMGRWAEVYFTNPPEKRGAAIAELLRELESAAPPPLGPVQAVHEEEVNQRTEIAPAQEGCEPAEYLRTCKVCAYENSTGQFYCGMCGTSLQVFPEEPLPEAVETTPMAAENNNESASLEASQFESALEPALGYAAHSTESTTTWEGDGKSLGAESTPAPVRYRLYVGAALVVLLLVLAYMTWRGTKENSGAAGQQSASSPTPTSVPSQTETAGLPTATPGISPESNASPSAMTSQNQRAPTPGKNQAARPQPASPIVSVAASPSTSAAEPTGAEDLATAENYLNGTDGASRNSKEAAQWLWKAVGKGNLTAATVLSDLYLRGDGVSKSCDQARLLLDAAARKGSRAAAERLTNLQAFGCQ